jgi:hypothetical protein
MTAIVAVVDLVPLSIVKDETQSQFACVIALTITPVFAQQPEDLKPGEMRGQATKLRNS